MKTSKFDAFIKRTNVRNINLTARLLNKVFLLGEILFPRATRNFVRKKFFTPVTKPLTRKQEKWIEKASAFKIASRGRQLSFWKIGEGPSILFVHGWNGRGVQFHRFFRTALEAGYSVIFYDAPAHGDSEGDMTNYLEITASVDRLFEHEIGNEIVGVVAHSLGTSALINHLSRVKSNIPTVLIAPAFHLMELLFTSFLMHGVPKKTFISLLQEVEEDFQIPLKTQNPIDLISKVENKILIIHDKKDKTTPITPSRLVAAQRENVDLLETDGYGHSQLLKKEEVIAEALEFFSTKKLRQNMHFDYAIN